MNSDLDECKVIIFAGENCYRCKVQEFLISNEMNYEIYRSTDMNKKNSCDVFSKYKILNEQDIPTFILLYKDMELFRTHEPKITPIWASQLVKLIKQKDVDV